MEGYNGLPPSSTIPFYWAPGWNSAQSVHKYQVEAGGPLKGGNPGVRLFKGQAVETADVFTEIPQAFRAIKGEWLLLPKFHLFGSGELSVYTKAIRQLSPDPVIIVSKEGAAQLKATEGTTVTLNAGNTAVSLPVKIQEELANGVVLVSKGLPDMEELNWGSKVTIQNNIP
jgi:NADH-quinone oxidoreductase subunit G